MLVDSVCPPGFEETSLHSTSLVQSYVAHHLSALCTTDLRCIPWCTMGTHFLRSHEKLGPPCAPWCITQLCTVEVVHNIGSTNPHTHSNIQIDATKCIISPLWYVVHPNGQLVQNTVNSPINAHPPINAPPLFFPAKFQTIFHVFDLNSAKNCPIFIP